MQAIVNSKNEVLLLNPSPGLDRLIRDKGLDVRTVEIEVKYEIIREEITLKNCRNCFYYCNGINMCSYYDTIAPNKICNHWYYDI
jgi:hypothetical protein